MPSLSSNVTMATLAPPIVTNGSFVKLSPPDYMYVYVTLCNVIMFVVGILGNAMVIHVIVRMRALRSRVNYFLGSLAVADLLVLVVCQPSAMLAFYTRDRWVLGYFICKTIPFLEHLTLHASVLTLLVIGFERFFTICTPLAEKVNILIYRGHMSIYVIPIFLHSTTPISSCPWEISVFMQIMCLPQGILQLSTICSSNAFILILPVWGVASLLALPFAFITQLEEATYYDNSKVMICHIKVSDLLPRVFIVTTIGLMFLIPLLLLIFLYSSVIFKLRKLSANTATDDSGGTTSCEVVNPTPVTTTTSHRRHQIHPTKAKSGRHRRQVSRMMVAIVVLFFVSLLPLKILSLFLIFTSEKTLQDLGFESYHNLLNIARLMTYINSAGNPIIYAWMSPRFRRAFHLSTPKCRCPKESPPKRGSFVYRYQQPMNDTPQVGM